MATLPRNERKTKISLTLAPKTVMALDAAVAAGRYASRSAALAGALESWVREERGRKRDAEIDAYYDALTPEEIEEDRLWTGAGARSLAREVDAAPQGRVQHTRS